MRYLLVITLVFVPVLTSAFESNDGLRKQLHRLSKNIEKHVSWAAVTDSLYEQIRSRANVNNEGLTEKQINEKVRKYITEKYAPVLVKNYFQIYSQLKSENKDFSDCNNIVPIRPGEDVLKALCVRQDNSSIVVQYMTKGYAKGWSKSLVFIFESLNSKDLQLKSIKLQFNNDTKVYIEGI